MVISTRHQWRSSRQAISPTRPGRPSAERRLTNWDVFPFLLVLLMTLLSFTASTAQTYTANFSTQPTINKYGYENQPNWPWNSTVTVNLGGVDYLITDAINGSFTWNGSAIAYETAGDVSLHIKRKDGLAFKFYGVSLKYTNYQSAPYYVYPFLTVQYATTGSAQADEQYDANQTLTLSKSAGVAVTGSGVTLKFSGLATLILDDLIVGPSTGTQPTQTAPTVTTRAASEITTISATLGGNVTADGGADVTERGVVYSVTNTVPAINGSGVTQNTNGSSTGSFSETISGLVPGTTYYVRAYARNSVGTSYGSVQTFTTAIPTITLAPTTLPGGTLGSAYTQTITASGGASPYSYAVTAGALPSGLTLSSTGVLAGTPTAGGSYNFTVRATDTSPGGGPYSGTQTYSLTIAPPAITGLAVTPATVCVGNPVTVTATIGQNAGTYSYTLAYGSQIILSSTTRAVSQTFTAVSSGQQVITLRAGTSVSYNR